MRSCIRSPLVGDRTSFLKEKKKLWKNVIKKRKEKRSGKQGFEIIEVVADCDPLSCLYLPSDKRHMVHPRGIVAVGPGHRLLEIREKAKKG